MNRTPRHSKRWATGYTGKGYTIVELMLALALLTVGSAGIITMQRVTAQSNRHAKQLSIGTHIAQAWIDELVADSSQWRTSGDFTGTNWLNQHGTVGWFRPAYSDVRRWGAAFDIGGNPQQTASNSTVFCSDLRLTWLYNEVGAGAQGSGLLRAEVRVYWQRTPVAELAIPLGPHPCNWSALDISGPEGAKAHHFVFLSTALLQHDQ
ncbi:MAG TPA: type II secretion system protein [Polyangiaceae bacterium]|nr:type II secretion system protein [Polyangiaceae bacterium]